MWSTFLSEAYKNKEHFFTDLDKVVRFVKSNFETFEFKFQSLILFWFNLSLLYIFVTVIIILSGDSMPFTLMNVYGPNYDDSDIFF